MSVAHHPDQPVICSPVPAVCAELDSLMHCDQQAVGTCSMASVHPGDLALSFWTSFASMTKLSHPNVGFSLNNDMALIGRMFLSLGTEES